MRTTPASSPTACSTQPSSPTYGPASVTRRTMSRSESIVASRCCPRAHDGDASHIGPVTHPTSDPANNSQHLGVSYGQHSHHHVVCIAMSSGEGVAARRWPAPRAGPPLPGPGERLGRTCEGRTSVRLRGGREYLGPTNENACRLGDREHAQSVDVALGVDLDRVEDFFPRLRRRKRRPINIIEGRERNHGPLWPRAPEHTARTPLPLPRRTPTQGFLGRSRG